MENQLTAFNLRMPENLKNAIAKKAEGEKRSLNKQINLILEKYALNNLLLAPDDLQSIPETNLAICK